MSWERRSEISNFVLIDSINRGGIFLTHLGKNSTSLEIKMNRVIFGAIILFFASVHQSDAAELLLFGDGDHKTFLGCLNCSEYSSESICNEYGRVGSEYSSLSIFHGYAKFGSEYSSSSPWNEYSSSNSVPIVVDERGRIYGFFTINEYRSDAVDFAETLKDIYKYSNGDLELVRDKLCNFFK